MKNEQGIMAGIERITEGEWFEVDPQAIDRGLFEKERKDPEQEKTRQLILEAFVEFDANPEKYSGKFEIMVPNTTWELRTVYYGTEGEPILILEKMVLGTDIMELACVLGDRTADWVEQALEWAQRICNGETWEALCNTEEKAYFHHRIIVWKNNKLRIVGNATIDCHSGYYRPCPATYVCDYDVWYNDILNNNEPVVVRYKK